MICFKHPYKFLILILIRMVSLCSTAEAQDSLAQEKKGFFATLSDKFIDKEISHWSVRGLGNFKDNSFKLRNDSLTLEYTPTNRGGIGFGVASSKLVLDLIFNLKVNKEEPTSRFDMQGDIMAGNSYLYFQVQNYQGYRVESKSSEVEGVFRPDIESLVISLNYSYIFNDINPASLMYSDVLKQEESNGSPMLGMYTNYHRFRADSSIVPGEYSEFFNEQAQIIFVRQYGVGLNLGYAYYFSLPSDFFIILAVIPGAGLSFKTVTAETTKYNPKSIWETSIFTHAVVGYNGPRWYVDLSNGNQWYVTSIDYRNYGATNSYKFKMAVGYKLVRRKNVNHN